MPIQKYPKGSAYDLIVSNPPYFQNSLLPPSVERRTARHTRSLTQTALLDCVRHNLVVSGRFGVILPAKEAKEFIELAAKNDLHCCRLCEFRSRREKPVERLLLEFSFNRGIKPELTQLILYDDDENWSDDYKQLTGDFYLRI